MIKSCFLAIVGTILGFATAGFVLGLLFGMTKYFVKLGFGVLG